MTTGAVAPIGSCHTRGMPDRRTVGTEHEDRVADYLLSAGYTIVTRRFKVAGGEIDIVAMDGDTLVFVEVKFRSRSAPEDAVDTTKQARFDSAVSAYLQKTGSNQAKCRYDLVAVTPTEIRHHVGGMSP